MRDIPVFTTEYGVASLILREIPYRGEAYVQIQDVQPGMTEALVRECAAFCRMAGADRILAKGHEDLACFPLHCCVWQMQGSISSQSDADVWLFPVTEETVTKWRGILNERMRFVDNAATLDSKDEKRILDSAGAYFVHDRDGLLGVGWFVDETVEAVAGCRPGAGSKVMTALLSLSRTGTVTLQVASTNKPALALYQRLGFVKTAEISRWYRVG